MKGRAFAVKIRPLRSREYFLFGEIDQGRNEPAHAPLDHLAPIVIRPECIVYKHVLGGFGSGFDDLGRLGKRRVANDLVAFRRLEILPQCGVHAPFQQLCAHLVQVIVYAARQCLAQLTQSRFDAVVYPEYQHLESGESEDAGQQNQKYRQQPQLTQPESLPVVHKDYLEYRTSHANRKKHRGEPNNRCVGDRQGLPFKRLGRSETAQRPFALLFDLGWIVANDVDQDGLQEKLIARARQQDVRQVDPSTAPGMLRLLDVVCFFAAAPFLRRRSRRRLACVSLAACVDTSLQKTGKRRELRSRFLFLIHYSPVVRYQEDVIEWQQLGLDLQQVADLERTEEIFFAAGMSQSAQQNLPAAVAAFHLQPRAWTAALDRVFEQVESRRQEVDEIPPGLPLSRRLLQVFVLRPDQQKLVQTFRPPVELAFLLGFRQLGIKLQNAGVGREDSLKLIAQRGQRPEVPIHQVFAFCPNVNEIVETESPCEDQHGGDRDCPGARECIGAFRRRLSVWIRLSANLCGCLRSSPRLLERSPERF